MASMARIIKSMPITIDKPVMTMLIINITVIFLFLLRPSFFEAIPSFMNRTMETITTIAMPSAIAQPMIGNKIFMDTLLVNEQLKCLVLQNIVPHLAEEVNDLKRKVFIAALGGIRLFGQIQSDVYFF